MDFRCAPTLHHPMTDAGSRFHRVVWFSRWPLRAFVKSFGRDRFSFLDRLPQAQKDCEVNSHCQNRLLFTDWPPGPEVCNTYFSHIRSWSILTSTSSHFWKHSYWKREVWTLPWDSVGTGTRWTRHAPAWLIFSSFRRHFSPRYCAKWFLCSTSLYPNCQIPEARVQFPSLHFAKSVDTFEINHPKIEAFSPPAPHEFSRITILRVIGSLAN